MLRYCLPLLLRCLSEMHVPELKNLFIYYRPNIIKTLIIFFMSCPTAKARKWTRCCIVAGSIQMAIGIFIVVFVPLFLKKMIHGNFAVDSPTADGLSGFLSMPKSEATVYQAFYIYNVTNPWEIENNGSDPILTEHGPYTYQMNKVKPKENLAWRADGTLEYVEHTQYIFVPSMSSGSESDIFTTVNLGYVGALNQVRDQPDVVAIVKFLIADAKVPLFQVNELNVSQIIWGYNNTLLEILHVIDPTLNPWVGILTKDDTNDVILPAAVKSGGGAADGYPQPSYNDIKAMTMWNGMNHELTYWRTSYGNMINGTDGTSFHPYIDEDEDLRCFVDTLYLSLTLVPCGTTTYNGVKLLCRHVPDWVLASEAVNPDNAAFYMTTTGFNPFPPSVGQPIHMSLPHFHRANWSSPIVNKIKYIPDNHESEQYDTRLYIEPFTGQLFQAHKRLQVNTLLEPNVTAPANATHTYFPVLWVDQYPIVTDDTITTFKLLIYLPYYGSLTIGPFLIALGLALVVSAIVRCTCVKAKNSDTYHDLEYAPLPTSAKAGLGYRDSASVNKI